MGTICAVKLTYTITEIFSGEVIAESKSFTKWEDMLMAAHEAADGLAEKNRQFLWYLVKFFINGDEANEGLAVCGHHVHKMVHELEPVRDSHPTGKIYR